MKIDFKKEVLKRKDQMIKELQGLMQINSELTTYDPNRKGAPFGKGNKEALDYMLDIGKKDGFKVLDVDGYAGHIEYGEQEDYVAIVGHLDVVPAGSDWTYPAYGAEIHNNRIYGRGAEDDKGPTVAAYYAMKILKELDLPLSKRIKVILGSDEESGWRCVNHYFSKFPEEPVSGFIPDADFPLIYAEKGIVRVVVKGDYENTKLISFNGGLRDNMVPDNATALVKNYEGLVLNFNKYLSKNKFKGTSELIDDNVLLSIDGISAHGSTPELGKNAIDRMNNFLIEENIVNNLTTLIHNKLANETNGSKLGIKYKDKEMGPLTVNTGVLNAKDNEFKLVLNIRYPNGVVFDELFSKIKNTLVEFDVTYEHHQKLLYNDPNSELVNTLMDAYIKHTGDKKAKPVTIGGGTFARALPNVVAFGPHFPGKPSYIHQRDEYIDIDDLVLATIIYTEALYNLAK